MNLYITDSNGNLASQDGRSVVAKFDDGKMLELTDSPQPLPAEIPEGIHILGGRMPSGESDTAFSPLNVMPVAANGVIIALQHENRSTSGEITLFITQEDGALRPVEEGNVLMTLRNGKTGEVMTDYAKQGLLIWGGREPLPGLSLEETRKRTESLGIFPLASNVVHLFPYQLA